MTRAISFIAQNQSQEVEKNDHYKYEDGGIGSYAGYTDAEIPKLTSTKTCTPKRSIIQGASCSELQSEAVMYVSACDRRGPPLNAPSA